MRQSRFSGPAYYRIAVEGRVGPHLSDRFGSLRVIAPPVNASHPVTVLQGMVADQGELSGILNTLHDFHLPLLSVESLGAGPDPETEPDA